MNTYDSESEDVTKQRPIQNWVQALFKDLLRSNSYKVTHSY